MNKREKILGGISLLLVIGLIFYKFGFSRVYEKLSFDSSDLNSLKQTHEKYQEYMKKEAQIRRKYNEIVGKDKNPGENTGKDPQKEFSEFVSELCKRLDFKYPRIDPPKIVSIDNVDDYAFVTLDIHTNGDIKSISKLLKGFDREAVLIRELTVLSRLDNPVLDLTITVARMVQVEAPAKEKDKRPTDKGAATFKKTTRERTPRKPPDKAEEK